MALITTMRTWLAQGDKSTWAILVLSIACNRFVAVSQTSRAYVYPVHLAFTYLVTASLLGLCADLYLHPDQSTRSISSLLLPGLDFSAGLLDTPKHWLQNGTFRTSAPRDQRRLMYVFTGLCAAVLARIAIFDQVVKNSECSHVSIETFIPFAVTAIGYIGPRLSSGVTTSGRYSLLNNIHEPQHAQLVLPVTTFLYGCGAYFSRISLQGPASSFICPQATVLPVMIPFLQDAAAILDVVIIYCVLTLFSYDFATGKRSDSLHDSLSLLRTASNACLFILVMFSLIWFYFVPEDRHRIFSVGFGFVWAAFKLNFLLSIIILTFFVSIIAHGVTTAAMSMSLGSLLAMLPLSSAILMTRNPRRAFYSFLLATCSTWTLFHVGAGVKSASDLDASAMRRARRIMASSFSLVIILGFALLWHRNITEMTHPIDGLIENARDQHFAWLDQAKTSNTLAQAVTEYRRRYNRNPPPGFGLWYEYAMDRNSSVIDDFDGMIRDLRPFEQYSPADLRRMTWEVMTEEWTGVGSIEIRNGAARIGGNVPDTHRWMLEGVMSMFTRFAQYLPDMDLPLNINDEPRISMTKRDFVIKEGPLDAGPPVGVPTHTGFTPNAHRAENWDAARDMSKGGDRKMVDLSFQKIFDDWGVSHCRSWGSTTHLWDRSQFCDSCTTKHDSGGIFLEDWKVANDACSQPDLAYLHGFYLSPAAFKPSHTLFPIFSQSKAPGYGDILYPSAWNYIDKAVYAPSDEFPDLDFGEKNATLFWRGGTTEGVSGGFGAWKGMARQRFHHVLSSNSTIADQLVLLPSSPASAHLSESLDTSPSTPSYVPASLLRHHIPTDIRFTDPPVRCGEPDCRAQTADLWPLVQASSFQAHWGYKYILDLDGAGFSGRFLPFLQSKSLVFKAALFREWYDDRLRPWVHFVPLDLRAQGVWASLLYFAGWKDGVGRRDAEAERIAKDAREWSAVALRKEDMEIYMFRLLLEWGRMTDDRRDGLGFYVDGA